MDIVKFTDISFEKCDSSVGVRRYLAHTAIITINGRYPSTGGTEFCEGETRIIGMSGRGTIVSGGESSTFRADDVAVIAPGKEYSFEDCESLKVVQTVFPGTASS